MRAQPQGSPLVDWGVSRTWKAVRLGAGTVLSELTMPTPLRPVGGPQTAMRGDASSVQFWPVPLPPGGVRTLPPSFLDPQGRGDHPL